MRGIVMLALCGMVVGCSSGKIVYEGDQQLYSLAGVVTVDGKPLEKGTIQFHPLGDGKRTGSGAIENGEYTIFVNDGVTAGKYRVEIRTGPDTEPLKGPKGSDLTAEVSGIETTFDFKLRSDSAVAKP